MKDAANYGFYDPPCNGKSGKFLEEERLFTDYPLSGSPPVLEVCIDLWSNYVLVIHTIMTMITCTFWTVYCGYCPGCLESFR